MKQIIIEGLKINVPESWYDINLVKYQKLKELEKTQEQNEEYNAEFMSLMLDISIDEFYSLPLNESMYLFDLMDSLTSTLPPRPESDVIYIGDATFVFDRDMKGIKTGMFVDLNSHTKATEVLNVADKVSSIFIREAREKNFKAKFKSLFNKKLNYKDYIISDYDYEKAKITSELFMTELPIPYIIEVSGFFLNYQIRSKKIGQYSIQ